MYRRLALFVLPAVLAGVLVSGCQKSANQPATSSVPAAATDGSQAAQNQAATQATPQPTTPQPVLPPAPPPPIVVPANTSISVVLDQSISSKTAAAGQGFSASVRTPIAVDGVVAIPKGAHVIGVVNDAKAAGRFKGGPAWTSL